MKTSDLPRRKWSRDFAAFDLSASIALFCAASDFSVAVSSRCFFGAFGFASRSAACSCMSCRFFARSSSRSDGPAAAASAAAAAAARSSSSA